ncbi:MAG: phage tail protein [Merismopedia sp. SIO2A8]|nr:phage tail protein [Symploca sp. SIO2B6]NET47366.1 phage tail protein [Merismopedia sp. SIO2A8]
MTVPKFEILTSTRFFVGIQLDGSKEPIDGYFMECQGFKQSQQPIEVVEVFPRSWGRNAQATKGRVVRTKVPGNLKTENITLRRGMTISMTFWDWFQTVSEGEWGGDNRSYSDVGGGASGGKKGQRYDGRLVIYDQSATERARFAFEGAWPVSYKISDVKAGNNEFEIEEVELAIDSFRRVK